MVTARNAGTAKEGLVAQHVPGIANARLIAAAPELLEVCEALLALNNTLVVELSESDWLKYKREAERKAKAALAKARGDEGEGC